MFNRVPELFNSPIIGETWAVSSKLRIFLRTPAEVTENQSGFNYAILGIIVMSFKIPILKCNSVIENDDPMLKDTAKKMVTKALVILDQGYCIPN